MNSIEKDENNLEGMPPDFPIDEFDFTNQANSSTELDNETPGDWEGAFDKASIDKALSYPPIPPKLNLRKNAVYEFKFKTLPKKVGKEGEKFYSCIVEYQGMDFNFSPNRSALFNMIAIKKRNEFNDSQFLNKVYRMQKNDEGYVNIQLVK